MSRPDPLIRPTYIAGPYGAPDPMRVAFHVQRASLLGTLCTLDGGAPLVVHTSIHAGVYGDDADPAARSRGTACSMALLRSIMLTSHGQLWVLHNDDGSMSRGTQAEVSAWLKYRRGERAMRRGTWDAWGQLAQRHGLGQAHAMLAKPVSMQELHTAMTAAGVTL